MASRSRTRPADQRAPAERAPAAGRAPAERAPVQRAPVHRAPPEEEYINIHDIDTASSEDENTPAPVPAPAKARATRPGGSNTLDEVTTRVAPALNQWLRATGPSTSTCYLTVERANRRFANIASKYCHSLLLRFYI